MLVADTAPQRTASAWDAFYADWVAPVLRFGTPALAVFVVALIGVRLLSRLVVGIGDSGIHPRWRIVYWLCVAALVIVAIDAAVTLPLAFRDDATTTVQTLLWITLGGVAGTALLAVLLFAERVQTRDVAVYGGAALLAYAVFGLAFYFPGQWHEPLAVVVWALLLAGLAASVAARIRGLDLGLRIEGHDADGGDDAGLGEYLRVRLHALGSHPPRGIQLTQTTDVDKLPDDALTLLPEGALAKLATLVLQLFQRAAPWRVLVTEQADRSLSLVMLRNGKLAESVVIRRQQLELPDTVPDDAANVALRTAAAAYVLLKLSARHDTLRAGLAGASDWRSLATQVIATDPSTSTADRVALLTTAVVFDSGNLAAYSGFTAAAYRHQHNGQLDYEQRLVDLLQRVTIAGQVSPLELRTRFNLTVVRTNRAAALGASRRHVPAVARESLDAAAGSGAELWKQLGVASADADLDEFVGEMRPAAWLLRRSLVEIDPDLDAPPEPEPATGLTILAYYERACLRALQDRPDDALDDLFIAVQRPAQRLWARTDPSFAPFLQDAPDGSEHARRAARFKELVGDPVPADFLDLEPVQPLAAALARNGIVSAAHLAAVRASVLATELAIGAGEARALHELAELHLLLAPLSGDDATNATHELFLLLQLGVRSRAELHERAGSAVAMHRALLGAAGTWALVPPTLTTVLGWHAATADHA